MFRKLLGRLPTPEPEATLPPDMVDFLYDRRPAMLATCTPLVEALRFEPHGILTRASYDTLAALDRAHGLQLNPALRGLGSFQPKHDARGRPLPIPEPQRQSLSNQVHEVVDAIGRKQKEMVGPRGINTDFLTRLREAGQRCGKTPLEVLERFPRLGARVQTAFTDAEREALADKPWREAIRNDVAVYDALRDASRALRAEAAAVLGEEYVRPAHRWHENRSSGRVTSHGAAPKVGQGWATAVSLNGQANSKLGR